MKRNFWGLLPKKFAAYRGALAVRAGNDFVVLTSVAPTILGGTQLDEFISREKATGRHRRWRATT